MKKRKRAVPARKVKVTSSKGRSRKRPKKLSLRERRLRAKVARLEAALARERKQKRALRKRRATLKRKALELEMKRAKRRVSREKFIARDPTRWTASYLRRQFPDAEPDELKTYWLNRLRDYQKPSVFKLPGMKTPIYGFEETLHPSHVRKESEDGEVQTWADYLATKFDTSQHEIFEEWLSPSV